MEDRAMDKPRCECLSGFGLTRCEADAAWQIEGYFSMNYPAPMLVCEQHVPPRAWWGPPEARWNPFVWTVTPIATQPATDK
jgi:hypothetical protein